MFANVCNHRTRRKCNTMTTDALRLAIGMLFIVCEFRSVHCTRRYNIICICDGIYVICYIRCSRTTNGTHTTQHTRTNRFVVRCGSSRMRISTCHRNRDAYNIAFPFAYGVRRATLITFTIYVVRYEPMCSTTECAGASSILATPLTTTWWHQRRQQQRWRLSMRAHINLFVRMCAYVMCL